MGAYQKGGEKSIQFSNRSTARQMVRSEISMITCFAAHHFQKARLWTPSSFRVFHLWRALQEILMPSHVCRVWASLLLQCHPPPLPAIPIPSLCIHGTHFPVASIVLSCHHRFLNHMSPCSTTWAPNGSGSSLSASCHFAPINAITPISVTQLHATESGHSIG